MGEMKWYILRTAGSKEKKAAEYLQKEIERSGLQDQVGQVLVPVKKEIVTKNGKRKAVERLLFPGYVLIQAELSGALENIIRNEVPNMSGFLSENGEKLVPTGRQIVDDKTGKLVPEMKKLSGRFPVPIRDDEAARILGVQDENADKAAETEVNYELGDKVKITDGPFTGCSGTVDEIVEDRSKLKVIVVIFGRKTLLELSFTQVTKE